MWQELLANPWWTYDPATSGPWGLAYRWFNFAEGGVWCAFALLVLRRCRRERKSWIELWYAVAFLTFGLSDLREAYVISLPLAAARGAQGTQPRDTADAASTRHAPLVSAEPGVLSGRRQNPSGREMQGKK